MLFTVIGTMSSQQSKSRNNIDYVIVTPVLRTGHESRPSAGSSHSSAPRRCDPELPYGAIHGSTVSKIGYPRRVKGIGQRSDFDVPSDRDRHRTKEPKSVSIATNRAIRCEYPRPVSICLEVSISNPPCPFRGMSTHSPLPEQLPNLRVDR